HGDAENVGYLVFTPGDLVSSSGPSSPTIVGASHTGAVVNTQHLSSSYDGLTLGNGSSGTFGLQAVGATVTFQLAEPTTVSQVDIALGNNGTPPPTKRIEIELRVSGAWQSVGTYTIDVANSGDYDSFTFPSIASVTNIRLTAVDNWIYLDEVRAS
ncbi:MAG: hypothetical protein AAGJ36_07435, partial [Pseudomonadota bacterium]